MNKCYKCGHEFEGQFCPDCGTKYESEKTCPDCGAALNTSVNFCNHCGHRFESTDNAASSNVKGKSSVWQKIKQTFGNVFNNVKSWVSSHKKATIGIGAGVASAVLVCVLIFAVIVPLATNIFSAGKLSKINLGDTKEQVVKILGEPYGETGKTSKWEYYSKEFVDLFRQQEEHDKKVDSITDLDKLEDLMKEELTLEEKIANTKSGHIVVSFDGDEKVSTVTYDAIYQITDVPAVIQKQVKKITIGNKNTVDVENIAEGNLSAKITYADGSYKMSALPTDVQRSNFGTTGKIFPSSVNLAWSDTWGNYAQDVKIDEGKFRDFYWNYFEFENEKLYLTGTIPTIDLMNFFEVDLPWANKVVNKIEFGPEAASIPSSLSSIVNDESLIRSIIVSDNNPNYYSAVNVIFDKNDNVVLKHSNVEVLKDNGNIFKKVGNNRPIFIVSNSNTDELVLPYYNEGDYTVATELSNKYKTVSFGQSELWTRIPSEFLEWNALENITIPTNVTEIGRAAFYGSIGLTTITIPQNVTVIESIAFGGCYKLVEICNLSKLNLTTGAHDNGSVAYYAKNIYKSVDGASRLIVNDDGYVFYDDDNETYLLGYVGNQTELTLPKTFNGKSYEIYPYAFFKHNSITSVIIPDGISKLSRGSFSSCSNLRTVTIPISVTEIEGLLFENCVITEIKFNGTISQWESIQKDADYKRGFSYYGKIICTDGTLKMF